MSVNKVILIGNLGKDPEIRTTQDGREVANFNVATTERWKSKNGEKMEKTEWHKVTIFNPGIVPFVKSYAKKGSKVYIEGSLQTRKWQDQSGVEKYTTEIVLQGFGSVLQLLDKKDDVSDISEHSIHKGNAYVAEDEPSYDILDDEVPF